MADEALRALLKDIESGAPSVAVTLEMSSAVRCGRLVKRDVYLAAMEELGLKTQRAELQAYAQELRARVVPAEEAESFLHLVNAVLFSGGRPIETAVATLDGRSLVMKPTPARVRLDAVLSWQLGTPPGYVI